LIEGKKMSRDQQRYRKIYSYYRVQPRTQELEIIADESLDWKRSVRAASAANHSLSGAGTSLTIGGVTIVDEDRVLLKDQSTPTQNGIYYFEVTSGNYALTRASDARQDTLSCGAAAYVEEGTHAGKVFILSTNDPITVGSTSLTWTQFAGSGGGSSPEYWSSTTSGSIFTTGSVVIRGDLSTVDSPSDLGTDVFFYVSGSISGSGTSNKKIVFGGDVRASGSIAAGYLTKALGIGSFAGGYQSTASGSNSFAVGNNTDTIGFASLTQGNNTVASGTYSHAEGAFTVTSGSASHAEGSNTKTIGFASHAEGFETIASGTYSHAEGFMTVTSGNYSHAEGGSTIAIGLSSHAEGTGSVAFGAHSHAEGYFTMASGSYQTVVGRTNVIENDFSLFVVGNGVISTNPVTREAGRSDIFRVNTSTVEVTGTLNVTNGISGSLTKLTDGTSYLIAGPNITINTGSNGAVQITGSAGGVTGTGTANYIPKFASSTSLDDSVLQQGLGVNNVGTPNTAFITSSAYGIKFDHAQVWTLISNNAAALTINDQFRFGTSGGGSLGIGTTSVAQKLHVAIDESSTNDPFTSDAPRVLRLQNTNTNNNNSTAIVNADGAGSFDINSYIRFINVDHADAGIITFGTANGVSVRGERMRIDNLGRVGIGTSDIAAVGTDVFLFVSGSSGSLGTTDRGVAAFGGDVIVSGSLKIGTGSVLLTSNNIQFGTSGMRIEKNGDDMKFFDLNNTGGKTLTELTATGGGGSSPEYWVSPSSGFAYSTGSVGIGTTTSTDYKLNVYQPLPDQNCGVSFESNGAGASTISLIGGNAFLDIGDPYGAPTNEISSLYKDEFGDLQPMWRIWGGTTTSNMAFDTGGVEAMRINASQNIGIGTTTISAKVHVLGSSGNVGMIVQGGTTAPAINKPILQIKGYDGGVVLHVSGSSTHGSRVGIGTTNPRENCLLDVGSKGGSGTSNYIAVNAASTGECGFSWSNGGADGIWKFKRAANSSDLSLVELGSSNIALLCEYSTGNVGINTDNPSEKLHVATGNIKVDTSGYGVILPSSPTAAGTQTLDCYYEQDLTGCTFDNKSGTITYTSNTLKLTRIGRLVTITGEIVVDTTSGPPTGTIRIILNGLSTSDFTTQRIPGSVFLKGWSSWGVDFDYAPYLFAFEDSGICYLQIGTWNNADGDTDDYSTLEWITDGCKTGVSITYTV
jgi:hypothetical protein